RAPHAPPARPDAEALATPAQAASCAADRPARAAAQANAEARAARKGKFPPQNLQRRKDYWTQQLLAHRQNIPTALATSASLLVAPVLLTLQTLLHLSRSMRISAATTPRVAKLMLLVRIRTIKRTHWPRRQSI